MWLATTESIPLYTAQSGSHTGLYCPKIAAREFCVDPLAARFSEPQKTAQAPQTNRQLFDTSRQSPQSSQNPSKHYVFRRLRRAPRPTPRKPPQPAAKLVYRNVGYSNKTLEYGKAKVICNQFQTIGGTAEEDMLLGDLVPNGDWQASDSLKIIAETSAVKYNCRYVSAATLATLEELIAEEEVDPADYAVVTANGVGWYTSDFQTFVNSEKLPLGCSYLVYSSKSGAGFTYAGQVIESEDHKITYQFAAGKARMIGNCTPVDLKLSDFVPGGSWSGSDSLKIIAETSAVKYNCRYVSAATLATLEELIAEEEVDPADYAVVTANGVGWYTSDFQTFVNNETIPAGEGMLVYTSNGATISLPTAL